ncbi:MAG: hypothetical protein LUG98_11575 [Tannerellaceae bacterium]|nr:hypothetical protein [Tannerellaceae bacterium]
MAILSVKYPILYTHTSADYNYGIYDSSNQQIYAGYCYGKEVDISPVLQSYMNADLVTLPTEAALQSGPVLEVDSFVRSFTVRAGSASQSYLVANDYNDQYVTAYNTTYITSGSVTGLYHPDSLFFADVNAPGGSTTIVVNGTSRAVSSTSGHLTARNVNTLTIGGTVVPIRKSDPCERFSLYWVNRLGGRSQLLLEGKSAEKYDSSFTRFETSYDKTNPQAFQTRTIVNTVAKSFVLRTGLLTDEQSLKMDDLFTSPKVWLHDHEEGQILAVSISDKSMTRKKRKNDRMFTYTINVVQAQTHIRR